MTTSAERSVRSERSSAGRQLPNPVAELSDHFLFTTLSPKEASQGPYAHPTTGRTIELYTLDDILVYTPFKNDYGPLNLAYTYDACVALYEKMKSKENKRRPVCLYTSPTAETKTNLTLMAALYCLIVEHIDPWEAFQTIAHIEVIPFRDAGNGPNEFALSIQDVLCGMWKASQNKLLMLREFDAQDYRYYEKVENGDLNVLGPFVAFASPMDPVWIARNTPEGEKAPEYTSGQKRMLVGAFEKVLNKFEDEEVGIVIRLNDELYNKERFIERGFKHVDMYFDDGTNPTDEIVRQFIYLVEEWVSRGKKIAVHCKAGLGRTGVLIGAYLIYKYNFTASEVIGYMRVVRPGMVVGPQQRYMQLNQLKWAGWAAVDAMRRPAESLPTPPQEYEDVSLPEEQAEEPRARRPLTPARAVQSSTSTKQGDAVGQPRKGPQGKNMTIEVTVVADETASSSSRALKDRTDASARGVKRGSTRAPVASGSQSVRGESPNADLTAQPVLARSPSNASCSSSNSEIDQRSPKRRPGESPLSKSGLSSPPPSRDSTPFGDEESGTFPIAEHEEPQTPPQQTKLLAVQPLTPPSPSLSKENGRTIPRRGALPFGKEEKALATSGVSRSTTSASETSAFTDSSDPSEPTPLAPVAISPRAKVSSRRSNPTPRSWTALSRLGGAVSSIVTSVSNSTD